MKYVLALLAVAGIWVSILALRVHNQDPGAAPPCAVTEKFDCGAVNHSPYAELPPRTFAEPAGTKHLPVAVLGILGYGLMVVVALSGRLRLLLHLVVVGFMMAAFLTYLEAYVIHKWCIYCLVSQGIVGTLLVLTTATVLFDWYRLTRTRSKKVVQYVA